MRQSGVYIIAEVGVNHNGDPQTALEMVKLASEAGADCVKFQTFIAENLADKSAPLAAYQEDGKISSQFDLLKKLELPTSSYESLLQACEKYQIDFMSSPFDTDSLNFLVNLGVGAIKLGSGEITNYPILRQAAKLSRKLIISTGMSTMEEIDEAFEVINSNSADGFELSLLHCNSAYPTPLSDVNLRAITSLKERYGLQTGFSDHTAGGLASIAAVAAGAEIIEKHITLDKGQDGPDHSASMEIDDFKAMINEIRSVEKMLGSGLKIPSPSELPNRDVVRKSIVATKNIAKGEIINEDDLTTLRPGHGVSPMKWNSVVGKPSSDDFKKGEFITS